MSFLFEISRPLPVGDISVLVRSPEFGDTDEFDRRQVIGETEGGKLFLQDLGVEETFYDATWGSLNVAERRDLAFFFGPDGTNKRLRKFTMGVVGNSGISFLVGTGQGHSTADGLATGDITCPATASFGLVRLEQSAVQFTATSRGRYTTSLRFRLPAPPCP